MKKIITLLVVLSCAFSFAQVSVEWSNFPSGVALGLDSSDNVYTAYWDSNPAGDISIVKRNSAGSVVWETVYDNTDSTRHETATWVETDSQGNVLVSGTIRSGFSNPVNANSILMKFNSDGTLLWRVVYENDFDGSSTKKCLIDANDNVYVLGIGMGANGLVTNVRKFSSSGELLFNYFDAGNGAPLNFKFTPDNAIVIVHRSITGSINKYSKISLTGTNVWVSESFNSLSSGDITGDSLGNTYVINGNGNSGSTLTKLSPNGTVLWSQNNSMIGTRVEVGSDNNPIIGGSPAVGYGVAFMKYDSSGNLLWQNLDADGASFSLLSLTNMKIDNQNAAYIAGGTMSQMAVCKVNNDGTSAWTIATSSGYPIDFDFGSDNSVYVTGGTTAKINQGSLSQENPEEVNKTIKIAPNPCENILEIDGVDGLKNYTIMDVSGRIVIENSFNNSPIEVSSLSSGLYQLLIFTDTNIKYQAKFVKK
ncbi:MAG: T9SS type A sorting domain-containing protein [Flavobacteriales bacterium]|nr:T9SS type A sorting domain-containing protein [Flavobacteriales bacterium]